MMTCGEIINYRNWYMNSVADIIGDEAMRDFIVLDPFLFLLYADDDDDNTSYNIEGFLNYGNMIIPLIVISEDEDRTPEGYIPMNVSFRTGYIKGIYGYMIVGRYVWNAYHKMSTKQKDTFLNNFYPLIAQCIDSEYFATRGDEFAVAHCGFKEYKKAMFSLEDIRCRYQHKRENKCEKTTKFGDRLLPLKNIAQTCTSPASKIYYYDFGYIYTRTNPMEDKSEEKTEADNDRSDEVST